MMKNRQWSALFLIFGAVVSSQPGQAQLPDATLSYIDRPLEVRLVNNPKLARSRSDVITADTISQRYLSQPSLWWTRDQLPNKLILNWLAYPQQKHIDVVVNPQFWNILDYPERYQLVNKWGTIARKNGFNVRIFNLRFSEQKPIVAYTCTHNPRKQRCIVQWQGINQDSLEVKPVK